MVTEVFIKINGIEYSLSDAKELYKELRKVFDKGYIDIPSDTFIRGGLVVNSDKKFKTDSKRDLGYTQNTNTTSVKQ